MNTHLILVMILTADILLFCWAVGTYLGNSDFKRFSDIIKLNGLLKPKVERKEHNKLYDINLKPVIGADVFGLFKEEDREVVTALTESVKALDNWLHTYASDHCDKNRVKEAKEQISKRGGTIAYISYVRHQGLKALDKIRIK